MDVRHPQAGLGGATRRERYEYDAYGNPTYWDGDFDYELEATLCGNPYYFTGRRIDFVGHSAWMIQYNRNRFYDYYTGCWLNQDPIGYQDGVNLYAYVNSNPVNRSDPQGLRTILHDAPYPGWTDGEPGDQEPCPQLEDDQKVSVLLMGAHVTLSGATKNDRVLMAAAFYSDLFQCEEGCVLSAAAGTPAYDQIEDDNSEATPHLVNKSPWAGCPQGIGMEVNWCATLHEGVFPYGTVFTWGPGVGAGFGATGGCVYGAMFGSFLGPAGTVAGCAGGAIIGFGIGLSVGAAGGLVVDGIAVHTDVNFTWQPRMSVHLCCNQKGYVYIENHSVHDGLDSDKLESNWPDRISGQKFAKIYNWWEWY